MGKKGQREKERDRASELARKERLSFNGWKSMKMLGQGQFGLAYLVRPDDHQKKVEMQQEMQGREYAVAKLINMDLLNEKDQRQAHQEVKLLMDLRHPSIVQYFDHFMTE